MHKLGVVVPYRNRWEHLYKFLPEIKKYLANLEIDYRIIIVEQDDASAFNRGMLCNIGFLEAVKYKCDYVAFHDIDLIPLKVDYSYTEHPVHLASDILPFDSYFGGITMFPVEQFKKINGFSNHYWGWGFEDDDLRYRCDLKGIDYGPKKKNTYDYSGKTVYFNGVDSYIKVENKIKYVRDFTIELDVRLGDLLFSPDKAVDSFPILSLQGNDLMLAYTSFNRFTLQFFDKKGIYYDITSDIIQLRGNKIKIEYKNKNQEMTLTLNNSNVKTEKLEHKLYNYSNNTHIILGTDVNRKNYFRGSIDKFKSYSPLDTYFDFNSKVLGEYKWKDKYNTDSKFFRVEHKEFNPKEYLGTRVPYRKPSRLRRLKHSDSGFVNGRWKHDMTRWNQLRFNNDVVHGTKSIDEDGLNTCSFIPYEKTNKDRVIHLKVGI